MLRILIVRSAFFIQIFPFFQNSCQVWTSVTCNSYMFRRAPLKRLWKSLIFVSNLAVSSSLILGSFATLYGSSWNFQSREPSSSVSPFLLLLFPICYNFCSCNLQGYFCPFILIESASWSCDIQFSYATFHGDLHFRVVSYTLPRNESRIVAKISSFWAQF
jgi:hypothetical protein